MVQSHATLLSLPTDAQLGFFLVGWLEDVKKAVFKIFLEASKKENSEGGRVPSTLYSPHVVTAGGLGSEVVATILT